MSTIDYDKLFRLCCLKRKARYAISDPWNAGGFRYATDGAICVQMKTSEADSDKTDIDGTVKKWPPVDEVLEGKWIDNPIPCPEPDKAQVCSCDTCQGLGYDTCDLGHKHECPDCDKGVTISIYPIQLADTGVWISSRYAKLLHEFGAVLYVFDSPDNRRKPIRFVCGEADGVVMPMKGPE